MMMLRSALATVLPQIPKFCPSNVIIAQRINPVVITTVLPLRTAPSQTSALYSPEYGQVSKRFCLLLSLVICIFQRLEQFLYGLAAVLRGGVAYF